MAGAAAPCSLHFSVDARDRLALFFAAMDAQTRRIAELETEVHRLHAALEHGELRVKKKVRLPSRRARSVDEVINYERSRHLAELFGGLKLVGALVLGSLLILGAVYLTDYLVHSRPSIDPPPPGELILPRR